MTPEEHQLLIETRQLAEQNAAILAKLDRSRKTTTIIHIVYWTLFVVLTIGSIYFAQSYVSSLQSALTGSGILGQ
ncbi:MAG: hypothetical protein KGI79_00515 [Patescibacteria group bacterium]|nr:hypothetical protein [Patescibacteria group bacterium]MDE2116347.1 hypothetical protein [Patescibacteria group bacterium]